MPEAKIQHIVSFSSEDQAHKAENLLSGDSFRKWKCAPGEKQASVVFRLEKSTQISSVDIGNEGSAFIEILVGRSTANNPQYQVILVASSFMSPQESRQGQSPNRVRIFDKEKLVPDIAAQKWDLIKVVCTQPFNKRSSYGLSFIKFHTLAGDVEDKKVDADTATKETGKGDRKKTFGGFKLKDESEKTSSFDLGSQMKMAKEDTDHKTVLIKHNEERKDVKRRPKSPVSKESEGKRRKVVDSSSSKVSSSTPSKSNPVKFDALRQKKSNDAPKVSAKTAPSHSKNTKKVLKKKKVKRPYDQILNGVIFVISGFQNPLRSEIREKALRMGAHYRKDWTSDSTHLICAFQNTPKFRQVMLQGGKIVKKDWIEDCASKKQLVSWKKYSMDPNQSSGSSSEEEEDGDVSEEEDQQPDDDPYGGSTDEEGGDTEDEIEKIQASKRKSGPEDEDIKDEDPYDASTDDEEHQSDGDGLPYLPDFYKGKLFLLYGEFKPATRKLLRRHIVACAGKICEYMNDDIDYVVTLAFWDDNFEQALASNAGLIFVRPNWVYQCGIQQKIVPYQPYVVESA